MSIPKIRNLIETRVKDSGDILTGPLDIRGNAASKPLKVRGIVGSDGEGDIGDLYLQYESDKKIYLGNAANHTISEDGSSYSGNAATSTKIAYPGILTTDADIDNFNGVNVFQATTWTDTSSPGVSNGMILNCGWGDNTYGAQIAIDDDPTYFMALRQKGTSGWSAWKKIPMADGTNASGTWGISISGNAAKDGSGNVITSTYLPLDGGTMKGSIAWPSSYNKTCLSFRPSSDTYTATLNYDYGGTECLFLNFKNSQTAFKIITGTNLDGFTNNQITSDTTIPAFMVKNNNVYTSGAYFSASGISDNGGSMSIIPQHSNEINFDGSGAGDTIYIGYRAGSSKPIPSTFVFGGSAGTSAIKFTTYYDKNVRGYSLSKTSSAPSNTDMVWAW